MTNNNIAGFLLLADPLTGIAGNIFKGRVKYLLEIDFRCSACTFISKSNCVSYILAALYWFRGTCSLDAYFRERFASLRLEFRGQSDREYSKFLRSGGYSL